MYSNLTNYCLIREMTKSKHIPPLVDFPYLDSETPGSMQNVRLYARTAPRGFVAQLHRGY